MFLGFTYYIYKTKSTTAVTGGLTDSYCKETLKKHLKLQAYRPTAECEHFRHCLLLLLLYVAIVL